MAATGKDEGFRIVLSTEQTAKSVFWDKNTQNEDYNEGVLQTRGGAKLQFLPVQFLGRCFPLLERICMRIPSWAGELLLN